MFAKDRNKLTKFLRKDYRDSYLDTMVRSGVAHQIQALRRKLDLTQAAFAKLLGKPQSVVSRLEDELYGRVNLTTLLDVAKALDIGLIVRFVDYEAVLDSASKMSDGELQPDTIFDTVARSHQPIGRESRPWIKVANELSEGQPEPVPEVGSIKNSLWKSEQGLTKNPALNELR